MLPGSGADQAEPSIISLRVAGLYETGTEIDNNLVLAQLPLLQNYYKIDGVSAIRFTLDNWLDANQVAWEVDTNTAAKIIPKNLVPDTR
jgi:ABC-type lipoprotein release transport system permease subunit